jgi:hypothetical protein
LPAPSIAAVQPLHVAAFSAICIAATVTFRLS